MATACFAEHVVVPATQAIELPEGTDLEIAALIGCAAMTGVGAVFNTAACDRASGPSCSAAAASASASSRASEPPARIRSWRSM